MIEALLAPETISLIVGAILTILTLSYLLGDNPAYRLALHLFIGAVVGYALGVALLTILEVLTELAAGAYVLVVPLVMGILLLIKGFRKHAYIGNFSVAFIVGVGVAVALSGALTGTMIPQIGATGRALHSESAEVSKLDGLLIVAGTICTLMAFNFAVSKQQGLGGLWSKMLRALGWMGRVFFLTVALGVAFAGALTASLSIFIGRIQAILDACLKLIEILNG